MIKIKKNFLNLEGKWHDFTTRGGVTVQLKIRPLSFDLGEKIKDWYKKPAALTVHWGSALLEDFKGFETPEPTFENKVRIFETEGLLDFVLERAQELREERVAEVIEFDDMADPLKFRKDNFMTRGLRKLTNFKRSKN